MLGLLAFPRVPASKRDALLRVGILVLIMVLAYATRLFSVLRYEVVIHEFDPYFNFRSTIYLVEEGFYNFLNWFDSTSWYPLGRIVGGTIYPGLMVTGAAIYHILHFFSFTVSIRAVCVLLAPLFSSFTALTTYWLTREVHDEKAGLMAAMFIALVPGYISRSVAGSYDNEAVAIFALLFTYFLWLRSVNTGSIFWATAAALSYFYMVSAWGGYVFIINLVPMHVLVLMITGRATNRIYIAYSTFYALGVLLSMQIPFVGFQPAQSSEHMLAFGTFGLVQLYFFTNWMRQHLSPQNFNALFRLVIVSALSVVGVAAFIGTITGYISPWTGRFYSLLDPTYAKDNIPIIASVSEHQPTTWASFFFDMHILVFLFPAGLFFCFRALNDTNIFVIIYGVTSIYFAGVMVRLMLVLAPICCILGGIAISETLRTYCGHLHEPDPSKKGGSSSSSSGSASSSSSSKGKSSGYSDTDTGPLPIQREVAYIMVGGITVLLLFYAFHCAWVTSTAYSSPSIVLAANQADGSRIFFDDFRETYYWLRHNTAPDARVMSWWDYGYQLAAMANRTTLVDNNTWNNTHIAQVGKAMASDEETAYTIMRRLDVDYVLVIFGGLTGYASDDINKFLWMIRIAGSCDPNIKERDYYTPRGEYRIDSAAPPAMTNSLLYKMSYYRFGEVYTGGAEPGFDRVRNAHIGVKDISFDHLEEAYTSQHWLVRVFRVLPEHHLAP